MTMQLSLESYNFLVSKDGQAKDIIMYLEQADGDNQPFHIARDNAQVLRKMCGEIKIDAAHTAADAIGHISANCRAVPLETGDTVRKWEYILYLKNISSEITAEYVLGQILDCFQLE